MNQTDPALPFLSDIFDISQLKRGRANLIVAPCHSGKTTLAGRIINKRASCPERVLYLIDTSAGRDAIRQKEHARKYTSLWRQEIRSEWWGTLRSGDNFRIMTYHHFGYAIQNDPYFVFNLDLIICDEMHNLIKYEGIENGRNKNRAADEEEQKACHNAFRALCTLCKSGKSAPLIVIMTATSDKLVTRLYDDRVPFEMFNYTGCVRYDRTAHTHYYASLPDTVRTLEPVRKLIVYAARISEMQEYQELFEEQGKRVCCLWGIHNENHPLSKWQQSVRSTLLSSEHIPDEIDVLIINAAYETSLNIRNEEFRTMLIHNSSPDVQTQVRGRLRHDIDDLYLYDSAHQFISHYFPEEYLNRNLTRQDTNAIVEMMNLKNEDGRLLKWPSIVKLLRKDGMTVLKTTEKRKQLWFVSRANGILPTDAAEQEVVA